MVESTIHLESSETVIAAAGDEFCPHCGETMIFRHDRHAGYSHLCQGCGHVKYLHRQFLRWNKHDEKWE